MPCSVRELLDRWRRELAPQRDGGKWDFNRLSAIEQRLDDMGLADLQLSAFKPKQMAAVRRARLGDGISPASVKREEAHRAGPNRVEGAGPRCMKRREHRPRRCCPAPALDRCPPPRPAQPHGCPGIFLAVSSADARGPLGRVDGTTSVDVLSRTGCYTSSCQESPPREHSKRPGSAKLLRGRALVTRR